MAGKPNIFVTSIRLRCPNCGKGKLFVKPNAYKYKTMAVMHDHCSECGLSFSNEEPGFYWGSMYISYGISSLLVFLNLTWLFYFFGWNLWALIVPSALLIILFAPINFRISRAMWLALNVRYFNKIK
jgi:uncharacterized protein (DUF983 family)